MFKVPTASEMKESFSFFLFFLRAIEPESFVRAFFIILANGVYVGSLIPPLRKRLYNYGARQTKLANNGKLANSDALSETQGKEKDLEVSNEKSIFNLLSLIPQVPHAWFTHFYILSVASSAFWGYQILTRGWAIQWLLNTFSPALKRQDPRYQGMTYSQVLITWALMTIHGTRRLFECFTLSKSSKSKMGLPHYVLGVIYYVGVGIAVWIEGLHAIASHPTAIPDVLDVPRMQLLLGLGLFLAASVGQNICHRHLAGLKKYTLPHHPFFRQVICPHYTAECLLYLSLAIISAPADRFTNATMACVLFFAFVNLAITAGGTKRWYLQKFGPVVASRGLIIPFVS